MKKIILILPIFLFLLSCSDPETGMTQSPSDNASRPKPDAPVSDATKLAKVVFFPGQSFEKRFYFYPNGLLKRVANRFGVTYETYIYDSNKNLISIVSANPQTFTYDSSNHLTSCNGKPVVYDVAANKYIYYYEPVLTNDPECPDCYDYIDRTEILLSGEGLMISTDNYFVSSDGDYVTHGMSAGYSTQNNLLWVGNWNDPSGESNLHDNYINPLKAAFLPACRALSIADNRFTAGEFCSNNNVISKGINDKNPESSIYEITYNAQNFPVSSIVKSYYFGTLENTQPFANYFYQTNTLQ